MADILQMVYSIAFYWTTLDESQLKFNEIFVPNRPTENKSTLDWHHIWIFSYWIVHIYKVILFTCNLYKYE